MGFGNGFYRVTAFAAAASLLLCTAAGCAGSPGSTGTGEDPAADGYAATIEVSGEDKNEGGAQTEETSASSGTSTSLITAASDLDYSSMFTGRDSRTSWSATACTKIGMEESRISITGEGAAVQDDAVVISGAGTYHLSGSLSDGQVVVDAADDAKVQLVLDGLDMTCSSSACILVKNADKVFVTLAEGSTNSLSDTGAAYVQSDDSMNVDAVIFSKSDMCFNGTGSLTVQAGYQDGIVSKDDLKFTGGTYTVTAAGKGIVGKDSLRIKNGTFTVDAQDDALHTSNDEKEGKGFLYVEDGTFALRSEDDAVHAATALIIRGGSLEIQQSNEGIEGDTIDIEGGDISIVSSDDGMNAAMSSASNAADPFSGAMQEPDGQADAAGSGDASDGFPGEDAAAGMQTPGGAFSTDAAEGDTEQAQDRRGMRPGGGPEGAFPTDAAKGNTDQAQDRRGMRPGGGPDGFPQDAAEGDTAQAEFSRGSGFGRGGGMTMDVQSDCYIHITGGTIYVNAGGDGIDSNGTIIVDGGTVFVDGPTNDGNGAIDCGSEAVINGGTVFAAGSAGMAESFSENSSQYSLLYNFTASLSGGTAVQLLDADGKEVFSGTPSKTFQSVLLSTPDLKEGTWTIRTGTEEAQVEVTSVSTSAGAASSGMPGFGKRGR